MTRILDWRLRRVLRRSGLPDLPEVRKFTRLAYWNGFTAGAMARRVATARQEAIKAIAKEQP